VVSGQSRHTGQISSIHSMAGRNTERNRKNSHKYMAERLIQLQDFFFFDHRVVYSVPVLMSTAGSQLSKSRKWILAQELAGLIEGA